MSLMTLINEKDIRIGFRRYFPTFAAVELGRILVEPTGNRYQLIGTAFDYLLRFLVKRWNSGHKIVERPWLAQSILTSPFSQLTPHVEISLEKNRVVGYTATRATRFVQRQIQRVKRLEARFLSTGKVTSKLCYHTLRLAQIDMAARSGYPLSSMPRPNRNETDEVRRLAGLVDQDSFTADRLVLLNPTFGSVSGIVGGADADLVMDANIVEIKTVRSPKHLRDWMLQLLGYYALSRIGGFDGIDGPIPIRSVSVYSARHARMLIYPLEELAGGKETLSSFVSWFQQELERRNPSNARPSQPFNG